MTVAETPSVMTAPASGGVVIVGAGQAGGTCAALLRRYGHPGPVTLIGAEDAPPYHRPPLSKKWLAGGADDELALRTETFYADNRITLLCSTRVVAVERSARRVVLDSGGTFRYGHLVLATGARARRLTVPGANLPGVHYLRDRDDARALRRALDAATRLVVVGGGYLGLEVAASARSLGVEVQIIEGSHRALSRAASAPVGEAVARLHHDRGVVLHVGVEVARRTRRCPRSVTSPCARSLGCFRAAGSRASPTRSNRPTRSPAPCADGRSGGNPHPGSGRTSTTRQSR